jgi:hypothetical protein
MEIVYFEVLPLVAIDIIQNNVWLHNSTRLQNVQGKNELYGNDVEIIAINEFYKCFSMFIL